MSSYLSQPKAPTQIIKPQHKEGAWDYYPLRVNRIIRETDDACSIIFEIPEDLRELFSYEAGQYLTINIELNGESKSRCYSLASSPATDEEIKITVKAVPGGEVSVWSNTELKEGDIVKVMPPGGRFVLKQGVSSILMFSGGSGITPSFSILKTALATTDRRVKLLYANRDKQSIIFRDELEKIQQQYPEQFELIHNLDDENGFVDSALVKSVISGWESAECYICGPDPFMDVIENSLLEGRFEHQHIHMERFTAPALETEAAALEESEIEVVPEKVTIIFKGETLETPYKSGDTLLEAARRIGVRLPVACKLGNCATCIAKVEEGSVRMKVNNVLTPDEVEEGYILVCQSIPTARRVTIEYE